MTFEEVIEKALAFREERDWTQFHNPKDLAISISLEAAELLEVFQWSGQDVTVESKTERVKEELADVVIYCIYLADTLDLNLPDAISSKLDENARNILPKRHEAMPESTPSCDNHPNKQVSRNS